MSQILDPLDAKMKFVQSLTHKNKTVSVDNEDNFLKPVQHERIIRLTIIEKTEELQSESANVERTDTLQEFQESYNNSRPKGFVSLTETNITPDWAKLAVASSSPNSKRKIDYY